MPLDNVDRCRHNGTMTETRIFATKPLHVTRNGTVTHGSTPIGRVVREVDGWSPVELNGDYLCATHYRRQSDAAVAVLNWWKSVR